MSRCLACNSPLDYGTLMMTKPESDEPEDMCRNCRDKSSQEWNFFYDKTYECENISEGLSEHGKKGYFYDWYD